MADSRSSNQPRRGTCARCGFRQRLLGKTRFVGRHYVYIGTEKQYCYGSYQPERLLWDKGNSNQ